MENWIDIIGYEGLYQVSDLGRIKNIKFKKERILKPQLNNHGYLHIDFCKYGVRKTKVLHRLVYESFNGKTDLQVDHIIEGNKLDNRLCNLQAISSRNNISKYYKTVKKSSHFTGVHWHKKQKRWNAMIRINGNNKHLGSFPNEFDAHQKYQNALQSL